MDDWRTHAACQGVDTNVFYPTRHVAHPYTIAREYCNTCPVRTECLDAALREETSHTGHSGQRDIHGMRGGLTPEQRIELLGRQVRPQGRDQTGQPINHGTTGGYRAHTRRGEPPCDPCRAAEAVYQRNRRKQVA